MLKSLIAAAALATLSAAASAGILTFGGLSLTFSDPSLAGSSVMSSGNNYMINLSQFSQSNFDPNPGEVDFAITANSNVADLIGVRLTYFGAFTGLGTASYSQTIGATPTAAGSFASASFSQGFTMFAASNSVNISGFLNLADNGDSAQITKISIDLLTVPEPSTIALAFAGLALAGLSGRRRVLG